MFTHEIKELLGLKTELMAEVAAHEISSWSQHTKDQFKQIYKHINEEKERCMANQVGVIIVVEDFENKFPDVMWEDRVNKSSKDIVFRLTK